MKLDETHQHKRIQSHWRNKKTPLESLQKVITILPKKMKSGFDRSNVDASVMLFLFVCFFEKIEFSVIIHGWQV